MPTTSESAASGEPRTADNRESDQHKGDAPDNLHSLVMKLLDDAKAENIVSIDLKGKTSIGDYMVVASGRSARHVGAIADQLGRALKEAGFGRMRVEGLPSCDWVLVDVGDVIVHVFRPEVREFYNLEKMWLAPPTPDPGDSNDKSPTNAA